MNEKLYLKAHTISQSIVEYLYNGGYSHLEDNEEYYEGLIERKDKYIDPCNIEKKILDENSTFISSCLIDIIDSIKEQIINNIDCNYTLKNSCEEYVKVYKLIKSLDSLNKEISKNNVDLSR